MMLYDANDKPIRRAGKLPTMEQIGLDLAMMEWREWAEFNRAMRQDLVDERGNLLRRVRIGDRVRIKRPARYLRKAYEQQK